MPTAASTAVHVRSHFWNPRKKSRANARLNLRRRCRRRRLCRLRPSGLREDWRGGAVGVGSSGEESPATSTRSLTQHASAVLAPTVGEGDLGPVGHHSRAEALPPVPAEFGRQATQEGEGLLTAFAMGDTQMDCFAFAKCKRFPQTLPLSRRLLPRDAPRGSRFLPRGSGRV